MTAVAAVTAKRSTLIFFSFSEDYAISLGSEPLRQKSQSGRLKTSIANILDGKDTKSCLLTTNSTPVSRVDVVHLIANISRILIRPVISS